MLGRRVEEADRVDVTFRGYKGDQERKAAILVRIVVPRDKERLNR